jgi:hypothetical protein
MSHCHNHSLTLTPSLPTILLRNRKVVSHTKITAYITLIVPEERVEEVERGEEEANRGEGGAEPEEPQRR